MPQYVSLQEAVSCIRDGDYVWTNAFLALANPIQLQTALGERVRETGAPKNITWCGYGFGDWKEDSPNEEFVRRGAVKAAILSHFSSSPTTARMILEGKLEGYNLPLGVMSKMVRAAAAGESYFISDIGLNLFVDPRYNGYRLNPLSTQELVGDIVIDGKRRLKYQIPPMDVAFLKGSSSDDLGNISFEKESTVADALSLAQAVRRRGGKVIVQVEQIIGDHQRPWNVIVPAAFVDYIVLCPEQTQIAGVNGYSPAYAGDEFYDAVPMRDVVLAMEADRPPTDTARKLVAQRAARELKPGYIANIGIGIPESVAVEAAKSGLLESITLSVESGAMNGVPASGAAFGSAIGAHSICHMAQQFDFYDGGGLDICFIGALEIDGEGNVNGHYNSKKLSGIGGFANITQSTPRVVFCATFTAGGLQVEEKAGTLRILQEGKYPKFVERVQSVSFSAENARENGQEVLYVTERCALHLGAECLELVDVAPGVDVRRDILDQLPFPVKVPDHLL